MSGFDYEAERLAMALAVAKDRLDDKRSHAEWLASEISRLEDEQGHAEYELDSAESDVDYASEAIEAYAHLNAAYEHYFGQAA